MLQFRDKPTIPIGVSTDFDEADGDWLTEVHVNATYLNNIGIQLTSLNTNLKWAAYDYEYDVFSMIHTDRNAQQNPKYECIQAIRALLSEYPDFEVMDKSQLPRPRKPIHDE